MRIVNDYLPKCTHNEYMHIYAYISHIFTPCLVAAAVKATTYFQDSEYHHLWLAPHILALPTHTIMHCPFSQPLRSNSEAFTLRWRMYVLVENKYES